MSPHVVDGLVNFATYFVPAVLIALADRVWTVRRSRSENTAATRPPGEN